MNRIVQRFADLRARGSKGLVIYIGAGDPDLEATRQLAIAFDRAGVDVLELGVPFSDPLADGLTNQLAAERALEGGMTAAGVFELVRKLRETSQTPVVFYTYYNLVFSQGVDAYVQAARAAGVDALLTLDLPPEEAGELITACRKHGLDTVFIVAPTTPESRLKVIAAAATGFIYYVSREGVTGVRDQVAQDIPAAVARIRQHSPLPVAVGFGISTRAQVAEVGAAADGVVVGSALVNCIRDNLGDRTRIAPALAAKAADLSAGVQRARA